MQREEILPLSIIVHIDRFSLSKDLQLEALQEFKELCVSSGTEVMAEVSGKIDSLKQKEKKTKFTKNKKGQK